MSLRIAIIGAGLAGVGAGRLLADHGHRVSLLENPALRTPVSRAGMRR